MHNTTTEAGVPRARSGSAGETLVTGRGTTTISDGVVAKIAGMAAREVRGVYAMGAGTARALGAMRGMVGGGQAGPAQGVSVDVGERQAAVDMDVVVEYGVAIPDLASAVRRNVIAAVERMCGLEVTEVNLKIDDIHLPEEDRQKSQPEEPRVR
ncbi:Asp23/Gls24 family envelope stress response protein [Thermocatellispora tengchongensis]|nr:Asp23/Gls24 family envelope stress response protein [Thermocatellispora tengchongensis]